MLVLVVDTSTPAVTAAVIDVGADARVELCAQRVTIDSRAHGELLGPAIKAVLATAGARAGDLAAIVAGLGPGPFTGLRVGLVTAAAMGQTLGIPTYGVCSLDGIGAPGTGAVLVATDARRKEIYWAAYRDGARVLGPAVNRPADVPGLLTGKGFTPEVAIGAGAPLLSNALPVRQGHDFPQATLLARAAADRVHSGASSELLTPIYLRRPDAVEPTGRKLVRQ
jgi:tRNA threonylcarbamoyl adenosine modification protein YeaZ